MNFEELLKDRTKEAEAIIREYLPEENGFPATVCKAMNYSMMAGGKRLRPILMGEAYRVCHGKEKVIRPFMAAIEMIHTHSLIHDDLPALDNDDYRRGRLTTHKVFGEAMGVLSGVTLLNLAYETMLQGISLTEDTGSFLKALEIMAEKTGYRGMLGGQSVDVENDGKPLEKELLSYIYENKTAALIEASLMTGAVLAGADTGTVEKMRKAGSCIGLAFQIQDDLLDILGDEKTLGKPLLSDEKNHKVTYVTLFGQEAAAGKVASLSREAEQLLRETGTENTFLCELTLYLAGRKY